jgi:hypothetical protein
MVLFAILIIMAIVGIGLIDISEPQIKRARENSRFIIHGITEIDEAVSSLWRRHVAYNDTWLTTGTMTLAQLKTLTGTDFFLLKWPGAENVTITVSNVNNGSNMEITVEIKDHVRIDPVLITKELENVAVKDDVISVVKLLRKETGLM